jgi:hypothetical protein
MVQQAKSNVEKRGSAGSQLCGNHQDETRRRLTTTEALGEPGAVKLRSGHWHPSESGRANAGALRTGAAATDWSVLYGPKSGRRMRTTRVTNPKASPPHLFWLQG